MSAASSFTVLEDRIGYRFKTIAFLEQALTHSSKSGSANNERLEFLGDRVLNLVMAHALFTQFPHENEGSLAKRHSALVQGRMLFTVGTALSIGDFIILSDSERISGGAENENIVSDATEAMLAAVFLDGGLEPARDMIIRLWGDNISTLTDAHQDPKTELQEWVQARGMPLPTYDIVGRSGPDHAPIFEIQVTVRGHDPVTAEGPSRRHAEKIAAKLMLAQLKDTK